MLSTLCRAHGLVGLPGHQHLSYGACLIPSYRADRLASEMTLMTVGASLTGRTFRIPSVTQACAARISTKAGSSVRVDAERRSFGLGHECVGPRSQTSQGREVTQCQQNVLAQALLLVHSWYLSKPPTSHYDIVRFIFHISLIH